MIPLLFNVVFTLHFGSFQPQRIGVVSFAGLPIGFAALVAMARMNRPRWLAEG